jgi:hypothetical protein
VGPGPCWRRVVRTGDGSRLGASVESWTSQAMCAGSGRVAVGS